MGAQTIGTLRAACRTASPSSAERPVVPITIAFPNSAACAAWLAVAAGDGEFDHDIAVADQLLGVVADRDAEAPDPGEFADILIDIAAARLRAAAGERAPFGSPRFRPSASCPSGRRIRRPPSWSPPCSASVRREKRNGYRSPRKTQAAVACAIPGRLRPGRLSQSTNGIFSAADFLYTRRAWRCCAQSPRSAPIPR